MNAELATNTAFGLVTKGTETHWTLTGMGLAGPGPGRQIHTLAP